MNGMRRATAALLTTGAVVAGGCGGDDALSNKELADRASAICKKYSEEAKQLGNPQIADPKKAEEYFNKARDLAQRQQDELEELKPGDERKDDYKKLVEASQDATDLLGDLGAAAGDQDQEKGAELIQKLGPVSQAVDSAAGAVGAKDCASA